MVWVAGSFSRGSSQPRDQDCISWVSCTGRDSLPGGHLRSLSQTDLKVRYCQLSGLWLEESFIFPELWSSNSWKPQVEQASTNWAVSMFLISITATSMPRLSPLAHKQIFTSWSASSTLSCKTLPEPLWNLQRVTYMPPQTPEPGGQSLRPPISIRLFCCFATLLLSLEGSIHFLFPFHSFLPLGIHFFPMGSISLSLATEWNARFPAAAPF